MCRDNGQRPSPLDHRFRYFVERALIVMQREFVQFHVAALAYNRAWIRRERINASSPGAREHLHLNRVAVAPAQDLRAPTTRGIAQHPRPLLAETDVLPGLHFVSRHHPHIPAWHLRRLAHTVITIGVTH